MPLGVGDYAQAGYAFQGESAGDLGLDVGDVVKVTDCLDANWLQGEKVGHSASPPCGVFPASFVEQLSLPTVRTGQKIFLVMQDFMAEATGDLELTKGDVIVGTEMVDEAWWRGKSGPLKGIFPLSFVAELWHDDGLRSRSYSARAGSLKSRSSSFAGSRTSSVGGYDGGGGGLDTGVTKVVEGTFAQALVDVKPQLDGELAFQLGDLIEITEIIDNDWFFGRCHQKEGLVSAVCVELLEVEGGDAGDGGGSDVGSVPHAPPPLPLVHAAVIGIAKEEEEEDEDGRLRNSSVASAASYTSENTRSHDAEIVPYARVLFPFQSAGGSELSLDEGQIVTLIRHLDADWTEGEMDGHRGIFPSSFVDIVVDCPHLPDSSLATAGVRSGVSGGISAVDGGVSAISDQSDGEGLTTSAALSVSSVVSDRLAPASCDDCVDSVSTRGGTGLSQSSVRSQSHFSSSSQKQPSSRNEDNTRGGLGTPRKSLELSVGEGQRSEEAGSITAGISQVLEVSAGSELGLVLHTFVAQESGDVTVREGDTVEVLRRVDSDWLEVKVEDGQRSGLVPSNHVEIIGHWGSTDADEKSSEGRDRSLATRQTDSDRFPVSAHPNQTNAIASDASPSVSASLPSSQIGKTPIPGDSQRIQRGNTTGSDGPRRTSGGDVPPKPSRPSAPPTIRNKSVPATPPTKLSLPIKPSLAPKPVLKPKPPPPPVKGFPASTAQRAPLDRSQSLNLPALPASLPKPPMDRSESLKSSKPSSLMDRSESLKSSKPSSLMTAKPFSSLPRAKPHHVVSPTERRLSMSSLDSIVEDEMEKAKSRSSSQASSSSENSNSARPAPDLTASAASPSTAGKAGATATSSSLEERQGPHQPFHNSESVLNTSVNIIAAKRDSQDTLSQTSRDRLCFEDSFSGVTAPTLSSKSQNVRGSPNTQSAVSQNSLTSSLSVDQSSSANSSLDNIQRRKSASYAEHATNGTLPAAIKASRATPQEGKDLSFVNTAFEMECDEGKLVDVHGDHHASSGQRPLRPASMPLVPLPGLLSTKVKAMAPPRPSGPRIAPAPPKVPLVPARVAPAQPKVVPKRPAPKPPGSSVAGSNNNNNNINNNNNCSVPVMEARLSPTPASLQSGQPSSKPAARPAPQPPVARPVRQPPRPTSLASPPPRAPPPRPTDLISFGPEEKAANDVSEEATKEMVKDIKAKLSENQADVKHLPTRA